GKAGVAEVDVYSRPSDHLNGVSGAAHGPDAADSFHDLGEIDVRWSGEPEAEIGSPPGLVDCARTADQRLTWRTAEVDAGPASQPPLRHGDAVAACCRRQCGDQPGRASAEEHEIVVAAAGVLP